MKKHILNGKILFSPELFEEISSPLAPCEIKSTCHDGRLSFKNRAYSEKLPTENGKTAVKDKESQKN